jgi:hypothetical protein
MSVEKAELRADVVNEMGSCIEDLLDGSKAQAHRIEGAEQATRQAAGIVRQLHEQGVALAVRVLKSAHTEELKRVEEQRARDTDTEFRSIKEERQAEAALEADSASRAPSETPSYAPGPDNGAPRTRRRKKAMNGAANA